MFHQYSEGRGVRDGLAVAEASSEKQQSTTEQPGHRYTKRFPMFLCPALPAITLEDFFTLSEFSRPNSALGTSQ